jgi:hypothetical protein
VHRRRAGIVDETLPALSVSQAWRRELQRHRPSVLGVAGAIHFPEAALADALEQVVVADNADRFERDSWIQGECPLLLRL